MKKSQLLIIGLPFALISAGTPTWGNEEESPVTPYVQDFESSEDVPDELFIIDGEWSLVEQEDNHVLRMNPLPLVEGAVLFGKSTRESAYAEVRIMGTKQRRANPRFGVGLHGLSGYRFRVVPARSEVELLKGEEIITTAPYEWTSGEWCHVRLEINQGEGEEWKIEAWAWKTGEDRPEKPLITHASSDSPGQGKASAWGTPYNGKEILFDDLKTNE